MTQDREAAFERSALRGAASQEPGPVGGGFPGGWWFDQEGGGFTADLFLSDLIGKSHASLLSTETGRVRPPNSEQ